MKKIVFITTFVMLITTLGSAQSLSDNLRRHRVRSQITRSELLEFKKDQLRYQIAQRRAQRDGTVTPFERKRMFKMKKQNRRQLFRYKHNSRRRLI